MHIAAVAGILNMHLRTVQIARYATNITSNIIFFVCFFFRKVAIPFDATGSRNVAAVVNSIQDAVILFICIGWIRGAKIAGNTAYVHSTADIAFYVIGISNIAVLSTADNTAHVAGSIMVEASRITFVSRFLYQRGAYIGFVGYILQLAASTAAAHNAADVGCTHLSLMGAFKCSFIIHLTAIICMKNIIIISKAVGLDNAFVRGVGNGSIGNTANDTANIIATLNSIIVNQRVR